MTKKREEILTTLGVQEKKDNWGKISYRPQGKKEHIAPKIIEEYYEEHEETVDPETGESTFKRMYKCEPLPGSDEPRIFVADKYDATFLPAHDKRMIPVQLKGGAATYKNKGR